MKFEQRGNPDKVQYFDFVSTDDNRSSEATGHKALTLRSKLKWFKYQKLNFGGTVMLFRYYGIWQISCDGSCFGETARLIFGKFKGTLALFRSQQGYQWAEGHKPWGQRICLDCAAKGDQRSPKHEGRPIR